MSSILLTGWGLVGQALARAAQLRGVPVHAVARTTGIGRGTPLDLTEDDGRLTSVMARVCPDVVVHTAAATSIAQCDRAPAAAYRANVVATGRVLDAAAGVGARTVLLSTDWVFDGHRGHYSEADERAPVNVYGLTKAHAESLALARDALVVRGTYLGRRPDGALGLVERLLDKSIPPRVLRGKRASPLWVGHAADAILDLVAADARGLVHLGSSDAIGWREMATLVRGGPVQEAEPNDGIARPLDTSLDVRYVARLLGREAPCVADTLVAMLAAPALRGRTT